MKSEGPNVWQTFDGANLKGWDSHVDAGSFSGKRMHLTGMNEVVRSKNGLEDHFNEENPQGWASKGLPDAKQSELA